MSNSPVIGSRDAQRIQGKWAARWIWASVLQGAIIAFVPGAIAMILSYRLIRSEFRYFPMFLGFLSLTSVAIYFGAYYSPLVQQTLGSGGAENHRLPDNHLVDWSRKLPARARQAGGIAMKTGPFGVILARRAKEGRGP